MTEVQPRQVYNVVRPGEHDDFPHPNAVIVQLDPDSNLAVVGFTPEKDRYERARLADHREAIWGDAFAVEIDHQRDLTPVRADLELHVCAYVCSTARLRTALQLRSGRLWVMLSPDAVARIANGLLAREAIRPYLPRLVVPVLRRLLPP